MEDVNKCSLRSADVFPVVTSLPPKDNIFRRERGDDRKYACASQAITSDDVNFFYSL